MKFPVLGTLGKAAPSTGFCSCQADLTYISAAVLLQRQRLAERLGLVSLHITGAVSAGVNAGTGLTGLPPSGVLCPDGALGHRPRPPPCPSLSLLLSRLRPAPPAPPAEAPRTAGAASRPLGQPKRGGGSPRFPPPTLSPCLPAAERLARPPWVRPGLGPGLRRPRPPP